MLSEIKVNLHPLNFIIISGIVQSLILACILLFYRSGNKMANRLIGMFVLICGLHFSWSLVIDTNLADIFKPLFWVPYSYLLAIGPLLFLYTKGLTTIDFKIENRKQLAQYHEAMPADYIVQHFVPYPMEVSVFYYHYPNQQKGTITGFLRKDFLEVTGDGQSTLLELMLQPNVLVSLQFVLI